MWKQECMCAGLLSPSGSCCWLFEAHVIAYQVLLLKSGIWLGHSDLVVLLLLHVVTLFCHAVGQKLDSDSYQSVLAPGGRCDSGMSSVGHEDTGNTKESGV